MNKKEAVERIRDHMRVHKIGQPPHLKIAEALNMALDALDPVPSLQEIEWLSRLRLSILDGKCRITATLPDGESSQNLNTMAQRAVIEYADVETQRYIDHQHEIIDKLRERMTPMAARREIAKEPTREVNGGLFGKGTTIWFCPKCGTFNTPTHKFCWKCGQALSFDTSGARAGTRAGEE